jgi:hypothetical protein
VRFATCFPAIWLLLGAVSCGTSGPAGQAAKSTDTTLATDSMRGWGVDAGEAERKPGEPSLVEQLGVFREKRTARDEFAPCCPGVGGPDSAEGDEVFGKSRLLFDANDFIYGVPTTKGWVCPHFASPDGEEGDGGPCWASLRDRVSFSLQGDVGFYRLYGVVADDVSHVIVVTRDEKLEADMGRNSFVFGAKTAAVCPTDLEQLLLVRQSGEHTSVDIRSRTSLSEADRSAFGCR